MADKLSDEIELDVELGEIPSDCTAQVASHKIVISCPPGGTLLRGYGRRRHEIKRERGSFDDDSFDESIISGLIADKIYVIASEMAITPYL